MNKNKVLVAAAAIVCLVIAAAVFMLRPEGHLVIRDAETGETYISYPLERGEEFSLCRQASTGRTLEVPTKYLRRQGDRDWCEDISDYRLGVEPGDALSIVEETSRGRLCKKNGVTGWYFGGLETPGKG